MPKQLVGSEIATKLSAIPLDVGYFLSLNRFALAWNLLRVGLEEDLEIWISDLGLKRYAVQRQVLLSHR